MPLERYGYAGWYHIPAAPRRSAEEGRRIPLPQAQVHLAGTPIQSNPLRVEDPDDVAHVLLCVLRRAKLLWPFRKKVREGEGEVDVSCPEVNEIRSTMKRGDGTKPGMPYDKHVWVKQGHHGFAAKRILSQSSFQEAGSLTRSSNDRLRIRNTPSRGADDSPTRSSRGIRTLGEMSQDESMHDDIDVPPYVQYARPSSYQPLLNSQTRSVSAVSLRELKTRSPQRMPSPSRSRSGISLRDERYQSPRYVALSRSGSKVTIRDDVSSPCRCNCHLKSTRQRSSPSRTGSVGQLSSIHSSRNEECPASPGSRCFDE